MSCAVRGDHEAEGQHIEAVISPAENMPKGTFIGMTFCEEHSESHRYLPPGEYYAKITIMENE